MNTIQVITYSNFCSAMWFNIIGPVNQSVWDNMENILFYRNCRGVGGIRRPVTSAILCPHINDKLKEL